MCTPFSWPRVISCPGSGRGDISYLLLELYYISGIHICAIAGANQHRKIVFVFVVYARYRYIY